MKVSLNIFFFYLFFQSYASILNQINSLLLHSFEELCFIYQGVKTTPDYTNVQEPLFSTLSDGSEPFIYFNTTFHYINSFLNITYHPPPTTSITEFIIDVSQTECPICCSANATRFYDACAFGICIGCYQQLGSSKCPSCRMEHFKLWDANYFLANKTKYPFQAVPKVPMQHIFARSLERAMSSVARLETEKGLENIRTFLQRVLTIFSKLNLYPLLVTHGINYLQELQQKLIIPSVLYNDALKWARGKVILEALHDISNYMSTFMETLGEECPKSVQ